MEVAKEKAVIRLVLVALFLSGVAAIINQIVWQRALKVYLAGSEAISSMIVVLVFMLGLGLGAYHVGKSARKFQNPLRLLGLVELSLFAINLFICYILTMGIGESANSMQRAAMSLGIPLRFLYMVVSGGTLFFPCYLMGVTMPLVSEASQRQLHVKNSQFVTTLFFLNTLGAVGGAVLGGFYLLPYVGQRKSLIVAAGLNGLAGFLLLVLKRARAGATSSTAQADELQPVPSRKFRSADYFGFFLGFWALAYEMYLFRTAALIFTPTPTTFSTVLFTYLLFWSVGLWMVRYVKLSFAAILAITFAVTALVPFYNHFSLGQENYLALLISLLPCVCFGLSFGKILADTTRNWGNDVGNFYFMNTIGSSLGILVSVLLGYRVDPVILGWAIALAYLIMACTAGFRLPSPTSPRRKPALFGALSYGMIFMVSSAWLSGSLVDSSIPGSSNRAWYGPDGVVQLRGGKSMIWDGLWHSDLSNKGDHVGTNNWLLGAVPAMAAWQGNGLDTLVVGLGTGITAKTLATYPQVKSVHVYEINKSLKKLIREFPGGTLEVASDPKVDIEWTDGRIGLILSDRKYDLITQQPTYLKQAGSSILLSREYMEIVKKRLKPGGVFCVYCNGQGNRAQAAVVRKAASEVFPYYESFGSGYMLLLSESPIQYSGEKVQNIISSLPEESLARKEAELYGLENFISYLDTPKLDWTTCNYPVTDDHPIVEYPDAAERLCPQPKQIRKR